MGFVKCSLVALALLALQHQTLAQVRASSGSASGGLFGNESEDDLTAGDNSSPKAEANGYLPPIGSAPSDQIPAFSGPPKEPEDDYGRDDSPTNVQPNVAFPPAVQPQLGCAAALLCVEEQFCTMTGVISKSPIQLTKDQKLRRVPMVDCRNPENGIIGKCCRDPDYVDPWPAGNLSPEQLKQGFDEQGFPKFLNLNKNRPHRPFRPAQVPKPTSQFGQVIRPQKPIVVPHQPQNFLPGQPIQTPQTGFQQNKIVPETKPSQPQQPSFGQSLQPAFQSKNPFLPQQPKPLRPQQSFQPQQPQTFQPEQPKRPFQPQQPQNFLPEQPGQLELAEFPQQAKQPEIVLIPEQPQAFVPEQPQTFVPQQPSSFQVKQPQQPHGFTVTVTEQPQQPGFIQPAQPGQPEIFQQPQQPGFFQPEQPKQPGFSQPEQSKQPEFAQPAQPEQPEIFRQPEQPEKPGFFQPEQPQQPSHFQPEQPKQQPGYFQPGQHKQPGFTQPAQPEQTETFQQPEQPEFFQPEQPKQQPGFFQPEQPAQPSGYQPAQPQQPGYSQTKEQPKGPFGLPNVQDIPQAISDQFSNLNPFKPQDSETVNAPADVPEVPLPATTDKPYFSNFPNLPSFPSFPGFGQKIITPNTVSIAPHTPGSQCGIINQVQQNYAGGLNDVQTPFGEIPWQAMILHNVEKKLICSGAVISPNVVMTAAHCVYGMSPSEVSIKVGEWKLGYELKHEEPLPFEIAQVQRIQTHPGYQPGGPGSDLAMLFLEKPVKLEQHIDTICLGDHQAQASVLQRKCISVGWGKEVLQLHAAGALMNKIQVDTLSQDQCRTRLQGAESPLDLDDSLICVKAHKQNNNLCQVDVGGPLACDRGDGHYELVGVYSQDTGCLPTNQVATFALIDNKWVNDMLNSATFTAPQQTPEASAPGNFEGGDFEGPQPGQETPSRIHYHPQQPGVPCDCQQGTQPAGSNAYLPPY